MRHLHRTIALVCAIACAATIIAQSRLGEVTISRPQIEKEGAVVTVRFRADIGAKAVERNYSLIFGPQLADSVYNWSFPVIIVQGKGAKVSHERQLLASGNEARYDEVLFAGNGDSVLYEASVPYQQWMEGATLSLEAIRAGCCSISRLVSETLAQNLCLQPEETLPSPAMESASIPEPPNTGDRLGETYPFVVPYETYISGHTNGFTEAGREKSVILYFPINQSTLIPAYADNQAALTRLLDCIRTIEESDDCEVALVEIAGFASPEGPYDFNERLARKRVESMKQYILSHSSLSPAQFEIFNGASDWQGLRRMVQASAMVERRAVLEIIGNVEVEDPQTQQELLNQLKRLNGGATYRLLLRDYFPKLRNATYIKVYYKDK